MSRTAAEVEAEMARRAEANRKQAALENADRLLTNAMMEVASTVSENEHELRELLHVRGATSDSKQAVRDLLAALATWKRASNDARRIASGVAD